MKLLLWTSSNRRLQNVAGLFMLLCALCGCSMLGPKAISMGRADYNEAINRTEDEQLLLAIIRGRYGETNSLMAVSSVAANIRFGSRAGAQVGIGPGDNYKGNLVPFSAGVTYEENPTITYVPVHGQRYLRQVLSPIPLDILVLLIRGAGTTQAIYLNMLVNRINSLQNPDFLMTESAGRDHRFQRFVELHKTLSDAGVLQWVEDPGNEVPFDLMMTGYSPFHVEETREYLQLLGLPMPSRTPKDIIFPVCFSIRGEDWNGIAISTRSTYDMIEILRQAVQVPEEHIAAGLAYPALRPGLAGRGLCIHSSEEQPKNSELSVKYRGYWYYIDQTDMHTKLFYRMIRTLWSVSISAGVDNSAAPVLTIPVGQ